MPDDYKRDWDGADWEDFSRRLVQLRHGAQNVQNVPAKVRGDAGIEFFTTEGCCYQSYAPEEAVDVAKAASAMKQKATRDINKLIKYSSTISKLMGSIKIKRWIMLCPFLDDKSVISHVRSKEEKVKAAGLGFIDADFRALVHGQADFEKELEILRQASLGVPLEIVHATEDDAANANNAIKQRVATKLARAYPDAGPEFIERKTLAFIRSDMTGSNALEALKLEYPDLWERSRRMIETEERLLETVGVGLGAPNEQLLRGLERLEESLRKQLPSLGRSEITAIANGILGTWLIECPLDFSESST